MSYAIYYIWLAIIVLDFTNRIDPNNYSAKN
jgi:hypothetical protein